MNNLDRLLDVAGNHAHGIILGLKRPLMATWVLIDEKGQVTIVGTPWRNAAEKEILVERMRRTMKENKTVAYSLVTEAWTAKQPENWKPSDGVGLPPGKRPDRCEVVMAMASDGKETKMRRWEIKRDWNETVCSLDALPDYPESLISSWLADLLKGNKVN